MKYKDLSFTVKDELGEDIVCDILSVLPNEENENESYVVFTDYMLDENNEFIMQYGKVIEESGEFKLLKVEDPKEIELIKDGLKDDIVSYVNKAVQDNLES